MQHEIDQKIFDASKLLYLLKVSEDHKAFAHGQIRRAASKVIREVGYEWATTPTGISIEESLQLRRLRVQLKKAVFESTKGWHSNQSMVWRRFRDYARKVGVRHETRQLIARIKSQMPR
jgi:hypothetical protein